MLIVVLVLLGLVLVALGAVVLIRFPDRPGGTIRFHGVEVGSKGAGLPLIVVGAVLVAGAVAVPSTDRGETTETTADSSAGQPEVPGLDMVPHTDCTSRFFTQDQPAVEPVRVRSVELGARDRRVLTVGERQDSEFGLVFSDTLASNTPRVLGALKLSRRPGVGFHVSALVDEQTCQPAGISLASDPGIPAPAALGDYIWITFRLAATPYTLLLNSSNANSEVLVTLNPRS